MTTTTTTTDTTILTLTTTVPSKTYVSEKVAYRCSFPRC